MRHNHKNDIAEAVQKIAMAIRVSVRYSGIQLQTALFHELSFWFQSASSTTSTCLLDTLFFTIKDNDIERRSIYNEGFFRYAETIFLCRVALLTSSQFNHFSLKQHASCRIQRSLFHDLQHRQTTQEGMCVRRRLLLCYHPLHSHVNNSMRLRRSI